MNLEPKLPADERDPSFEPGVERIRLAEVRLDSINSQEVEKLVEDERCGAIVTFNGVVRNHDEGRSVLRLDYEAHPEAEAAMKACVLEITASYPDVVVAAVHRVGALAIGDSALVAAVAAPHRRRAFEACGDLVDLIKEKVPIWKNQFFTDGSEEWVAALN